MGFAGYFDANLYKDVVISILPNKTINIKSWFPVFFPLKTPFQTDSTASFTVTLTRNYDNDKLYYNWFIET